MEINVITLEDNIDYEIIDEIIINNIKYVYLANVNDGSDFCIRKIKLENDNEMLIGLDDDNEFDLALLHFSKKHNN